VIWSLRFNLNGAAFRATLLSMSIDQIASEAMRLSARDRAFLAESLWESLGDPYMANSSSDDAAIVALAMERDRQIELGQAQAVPHDEMMARLRR
jgi:putative addiction module component (TIGR02574 family)